MKSIQIGVVMGSSSDWDTMQHAVQILEQFGIAHEAAWSRPTACPTTCLPTPKPPQAGA